MPMFIYSHNMNSQGANELRDYLGIRKIRHENSRFVGNPNKTVINWGSGRLPDQVQRCRVLNSQEAVGRCANKLSFFRHVSRTNEDLLPPWTEDFDEAIGWVRGRHTVCARTVLNGHSAQGLVLMTRDEPETFVRAPLYTQYVKKEAEYRIHVVNNEVIDFQRKVLTREKAESGEEVNWHIRNLANGFIYQRGGVNPPQNVRQVALEVMRIVGLDFGAVDVIYNEHQNRAYVLEINTAPGLQGSTIESYGRALRGL